MRADSPQILLIRSHTTVTGRLAASEPQQRTAEITDPYTGVRSTTPRLPARLAQAGGYLSASAPVTLSLLGTAAARTALGQIYTGCLLFDSNRAEILRYYTAINRSENAAYYLFLHILHTYKTELSYTLVMQLIDKFLLL